MTGGTIDEQLLLGGTLIKNDGSLVEMPPDFVKRATEFCSILRCNSVSHDIVDPQDNEHTKLRMLDCGYAEEETDSHLLRTVIRV